jgi:hypothetical protein
LPEQRSVARVEHPAFTPPYMPALARIESIPEPEAYALIVQVENPVIQNAPKKMLAMIKDIVAF